jgi:hypothetical protein
VLRDTLSMVSEVVAMVRQGQLSGFHDKASSLNRFQRRSRSVEVKVIDGGFVVDSFQVSDPRTLRSELRFIYRFLPRREGLVHMNGVEESWLPLGIDRKRREVELGNVADALFFLAA